MGCLTVVALFALITSGDPLAILAGIALYVLGRRDSKGEET